MTDIRVVELFAGVGGFRVGLAKASDQFKVVWSNQWEPGSKGQEASKIYEKNFGDAGHCNQDISQVPSAEIPEHDMLVGGFPCQDYSVARTLKHAAGLEGKKGVLWWQIHRILAEKENKPKFLFLENVDRLIKSPVKQRGRDFAVMLASLSDLGYIVEWRVINAADYGMPQRRRRVFLVGYHQTNKEIYNEITSLADPMDWVLHQGTMAEAFPVSINPKKQLQPFRLDGDLVDISNDFNNQKLALSPFGNSGIIIDRKVYTVDMLPSYDGPYQTLGDIVLPENEVAPAYFIDDESLDKWRYFKSAKNEKRTNVATGFEYNYNEGSMVFPDALDKPSRTIITAEGGPSASRFKHVIKTPAGKLRRLAPLELERLNMFPDNHTAGASDIKRAFFMGNALVVGIIEKVGKAIVKKMAESLTQKA